MSEIFFLKRFKRFSEFSPKYFFCHYNYTMIRRSILKIGWTYNDNNHLVLFDIVFRILAIIHMYEHISQLLIQIFLFLLLLFRQMFLVERLRTSLFYYLFFDKHLTRICLFVNFWHLVIVFLILLLIFLMLLWIAWGTAFSIKRSVLGLTLVMMLRLFLRKMLWAIVLIIVSWIAIIPIDILLIFFSVCFIVTIFLIASILKVLFLSVLLPLIRMLLRLAIVLSDCVSSFDSEVSLYSYDFSLIFIDLRIFIIFKFLLCHVLGCLSGGLAIPSLSSHRLRILMTRMHRLLPRRLVWFLLFLFKRSYKKRVYIRCSKTSTKH